MALILKQPGIQPLGQFDGVDSVVTSVRGGEVGAIVAVAVGSDVAAADADGSDGYVPPVPGTRPAVTTALTGAEFPLGLIDDGNAPNYGTLFGSVLGATVGQQSFGPGQSGAVLGPHTAAASGKLTLWTKPGTYAVTLDAVDTDGATGLAPTNAGLSIGDALYAEDGTGLLTPVASSGPVVARFLNFETNGSLVTTPVTLASAANSPVGEGQPQVGAFTEALIEFAPPIS